MSELHRMPFAETLSLAGKALAYLNASQLLLRMEDSSSEGSDTDEDDEEVAPKKRQIFFCSRTHSQLSQFVKELHRTPFAETLSVAATAGRKVCPTSAQQHIA